MVMDPLDFLDSVAGHTAARYPVQTPLLGTVDPAYTSGNPKITFDGETTLSGKTYLYAGYTPKAGDRVVLLPVGNSYLIIGAVGLVDGASLLTTIAGKAAAVHTHAESDVTSLVTDLAGKSATSHTHTTLGNVTVTGAIVDDTSWQSFSFSNSWTDNTFARYRMMPDGTVQFRGIITKATNPTNGETWCTGLPSAYWPPQRANFMCACAYRISGTQKVEVETDGTCKIWDPAAASGDICLDGIRYPVI